MGFLKGLPMTAVLHSKKARLRELGSLVIIVKPMESHVHFGKAMHAPAINTVSKHAPEVVAVYFRA